jgi:hypothetical protein
MKSFLTTVAAAVMLVLPASALAIPTDLRTEQAVSSGSLAAAPAVTNQDMRSPDASEVPRIVSQVRPLGTDVSAPDQQSPMQRPAPVHVSLPTAPGFDWGSAFLGAAVSIGLVVLLTGAARLRRRQSIAIG